MSHRTIANAASSALQAVQDLVSSSAPSSSSSSRADTALAISSTILTALQNTAAMSLVLPIRQAAGLALMIVKKVQGVKSNLNDVAFNRLAEGACLAVHAIITSPSLAVLEGPEVPQDMIQDLLYLIETLGEINLFVQEQAPCSWIGLDIIPQVDLGKVQEYQERLKNLSRFTANSNPGIHQHLSMFQGASGFTITESNVTNVGRDQITNVYSHNPSALQAIQQNISARNVEFLERRLNPAQAGSRPKCLEGTRENILEQIYAWAKDSSQQNILWLSGSPGAGKSAIASTVVSQLSKQQSTVAFSFQHGHAILGDPAVLWRSIAFGLATLDPAIQNDIVHFLEDTTMHFGNDIGDHFKHLIEEPLTKNCDDLSFKLPLVIIIDALDECSSSDSTSAPRGVLLQTLKRWSQLPKKFKLFVTARYESDIAKCLVDVNQHIILQTGSKANSQTSQDIQLFLKHHFSRIALDYYPELSTWPEPGIIEQLTVQAAGLFIWAETVIRFMKQGAPSEQLSLILGGKLATGDIDGLYLTILKNSFTPANFESFNMVAGCIILARIPLTCHDLEELLDGVKSDVIKFVLNKLKPVISNDNENGLQVTHQSFAEFLKDSTRSTDTFVIDQTKQSKRLVLGCMRVMNSKGGLKFNFCNLETSHIFNDQILDLTTRIKGTIPSHLLYACRFWAQHLQDIPTQNLDPVLADSVHRFSHTHLLHWLEVLSLINEVRIASKSLHIAYHWFQHSNIELSAFLVDGQNFVDAFHIPIAKSAPHIYLSALPFAPYNSKISKHFLPQFPNTLKPHMRPEHDWPVNVGILKGHGIVESVAYSPDGRYIVSGSLDMTVQVWNSETGDLAVGPLKGHTDGVTSVAYSSNGRHIVSGSYDQTIRVWNTETGDLVTGPLEGHTNVVNSVAYSPDGRHIVSGSYDRTIRVWNAETGDMVTGPLEGHTESVTSVAYSPDGRYIVSSSQDMTIQVWSGETGDPVTGPFKGYDSSINSVAYSPDGLHIVSGCYDNTIQIWNAETGDLVTGPLEGHSHLVSSVAYSPDGTHIVSGSYDNTIQVWNAETGGLVAKPLKGHTDEVTSVAYSPDGRHIVSGAKDNTIRVWNAETWNLMAEPLEGHTDSVRSVVYSPDGRHIASGSNDGTIQVWNAETGDLVTGPLKGHNSGVASVAYSPDGRHIVSGSWDNTIQIWNAATGDLVAGPLEGHNNWVSSSACLPDGRHVVSGSHDATVQIFPAATVDQSAGSWKGHTTGVNSVVYSPDGSHIVAGSWNGVISVWDAGSGSLVKDCLGKHTGGVTSVAYSPDGTYIVSGSYDRTIQVWNAESGDLVMGPLRGHTAVISSVAYSPHGRHIVSGSWDKTIRIWNVETGDLVAEPLEGHSKLVCSVAYSSDGRHIASGSWDNIIQVWNAETGDLVAGPFKGHSDRVTSVAYSPDGRYIVSGSHDHTIQVWNVWDVMAEPLEGQIDHTTQFQDCRPIVMGSCEDQILPLGVLGWDIKFKLDNSWVCGSKGEILFWVPPECHAGLYQPRNHVIIGQLLKTRLDFSKFQHGTMWTKCSI